LNLGIVYRDKQQFAAARTQFEKASDVGNGWGLPIYYIGNLYEQAARNCGFEFEDKLVYLLAVDTYKRAKNMDPSVTQAQDRISALSGSVPTKEDYFFRGIKSGQSIPITGSCYDWIGKSVTVP
jgi:tetratricopeptide (TPR) repeat protein